MRIELRDTASHLPAVPHAQTCSGCCSDHADAPEPVIHPPTAKLLLDAARECRGLHGTGAAFALLHPRDEPGPEPADPHDRAMWAEEWRGAIVLLAARSDGTRACAAKPR